MQHTTALQGMPVQGTGLHVMYVRVKLIFSPTLHFFLTLMLSHCSTDHRAQVAAYFNLHSTKHNESYNIFISASSRHISGIDKAYCDKNESQKYAKAKGLMSHAFLVIPNVLFQEVFSDFCDGSGFLPKARVGDAVRCLGENPLQSEVAHHEKRGRVYNET